MNKIWKKLNGYAIISVWGFSKERFLNLCGKNGIEIWDLLYKGNSVQFCIYSANIDALNNISGKTGCRYRVINYLGLPRFVKKYLNRFCFTIGIILFITVIKLLSSFVWYIDIDGNTNISDSEIIAVCAKNGLKTGVPSKSVDCKNTGDVIKDSFDSISWINITVRGVKVTIRLAEASDKSTVEDILPPSDIISDKNCIITQIIAKSGMPAVRIGDSVMEGDLLVSGMLVPVGFEENREPSYTHSSALIRGRFTDIRQINIPLQYSQKKYTGNTCKKIRIKAFDKNFNVDFIKKIPNYKKYDIIENVVQLKFDDEHPLPFFLTQTTYNEYTDVKLTLTEDKAKTKANAALVDYIVTQYPDNADIISTKVNYKKEKNNMVLTAEITSEQNIGIDAEISTLQEENELNGAAKNTN